MWFDLTLAILACYRIAELITWDDGPFDCFLKLREWCGVYDFGEDGRPKSNLGRLFGCAYCQGVWWAAIIALVFFPLSGKSVLIWLAIAGGQSILHKIGECE